MFTLFLIPLCFAYLRHLHVSDHQFFFVLDEDNPNEYKIQFLKDDFTD